MKIKKMKIKNFKAFSNFEIDFTSNKNASENEIDLNFVKLTKDEKHVIPNLNYIIGRNSIGKTSIIDAINFVATYICGMQNIRSTREVERKLYQMEYRQKARELKPNQKNKQISFRNIKLNISSEEYDKRIMQREEEIYNSEFSKYSRNHNEPMEIAMEFDLKEDLQISLVYPPINKDDLEIEDLLNSYRPVFKMNTSDEKVVEKLDDWSKYVVEYSAEKTAISKFLKYKNSKFILRNVVSTLINEFGSRKKIEDLNSLIKLANPNFVRFLDKEGAISYTEKNALIPLALETLSGGTKRFL